MKLKETSLICNIFAAKQTLHLVKYEERHVFVCAIHHHITMHLKCTLAFLVVIHESVENTE